jgi:hypothetical protein
MAISSYARILVCILLAYLLFPEARVAALPLDKTTSTTLKNDEEDSRGLQGYGAEGKFNVCCDSTTQQFEVTRAVFLNILFPDLTYLRPLSPHQPVLVQLLMGPSKMLLVFG